MVREYSQPYLARPPWPTEHGRVQPDQVLETNRFPMETSSLSSPPLVRELCPVPLRLAEWDGSSIVQGIEKALREQCKIPAQHYFVAVILDNGDRKVYTGPNHSREDVPRYFNEDLFAQCTKPQRASGESIAPGGHPATPTGY